MHTSPIACLTEYRIHMSAEQQLTDQSIIAVSEHNGFSSNSYLSKIQVNSPLFPKFPTQPCTAFCNTRCHTVDDAHGVLDQHALIRLLHAHVQGLSKTPWARKDSDHVPISHPLALDIVTRFNPGISRRSVSPGTSM